MTYDQQWVKFCQCSESPSGLECFGLGVAVYAVKQGVWMFAISE